MQDTNKRLTTNMARALRACLHDVTSGLGEVNHLMRHEQLDVAVLQGLQCKQASARSHCGLIQGVDPHEAVSIAI